MSSRMRSSARTIGDGFVRRMINLPNSILEGLSQAVNQSIDNLTRTRRSTNQHYPHNYPHNNFEYHQQQQQPVDFPFDQINTPMIQEEWAFHTSFEQQSGTTHPFFYACRFTDALKIARDERKLMFVYVHSLEHNNPFVTSFVRDTLCSEVVIQFLDANFVSWGGLGNRGEGLHMSTALKACTFPFCAVVAPGDGDNLVVMQQIEGPVSAGELVEILQRTMEEQGLAFGIGRSKPEHNVRDRENRRLREEQDAAYLAALKIDLEKERHKKKPTEQGKKLPKSTTKAETSHKPDKTSCRKADEVTQILIRIPNGERKEHSFYCKDKIEAIFRYIDSLNLNGVGNNYRLISNFPKKVYSADQMKMTLKEAGLHPRASLFLELL